MVSQYEQSDDRGMSSSKAWEREREAIFFALSFFQSLMSGFNADAPSDWV
jgi:hypothetical protein